MELITKIIYPNSIKLCSILNLSNNFAAYIPDSYSYSHSNMKFQKISRDQNNILRIIGLQNNRPGIPNILFPSRLKFF